MTRLGRVPDGRVCARPPPGWIGPHKVPIRDENTVG